MTTTAIVPAARAAGLDRIAALVTDGLTSVNSRRAYGRAVADFLTWHEAAGRPALTKATVNGYRAALLARGLAPSSVNVHLSAIRKLATEAADNGLLDQHTAAAIGRVPGVKQQGQRAGNWLSKAEAQALLNRPDVTTPIGARDRAILGVLVGAGLRRAEAARLTWGDVQQRDGRWALVDLRGKGGRVRTVPIPAWLYNALNTWRAALVSAGGDDSAGARVFQAMDPYGRNVTGPSVTTQTIYRVVGKYAEGNIAAHDLRRTFAKLAHKGGAALDQIQLTLGHASIQTTERYLGIDQRLDHAPCDVLGLGLD